MKRIIFSIVLLFLVLNTAFALTEKPFRPLNNTQLVQPQTDEFTFAVFGDFRTSRRDRPYSAAFMQILKEIITISPDFAISTGDAYYGYGGSIQRFKNEIDYFLAVIKLLDVPFLNVIGNHEVAASLEREAYIKGRFGNLYGSFDFGTSHFIMLDTDEIHREGSISGEQLKWLEKDIEKNKNSDNVFVFMHRPLFSEIDSELISGKSFKDRSNRDYIHELFKKYKVRVVFAGHEHLFKDSIKDGIRYIITGGGGAPFYQSPSKGGFFHYLLVKVKGKAIFIKDLGPYNLHIKNITGNDGFERKAEIEVTNTSDSEIEVRNIQFKMPRADFDRYKVRAISISPRGQTEDHSAKIGKIKDNGDGTAEISIRTHLPVNGLIRVIVEVDI